MLGLDTKRTKDVLHENVEVHLFGDKKETSLSVGNQKMSLKTFETVLDGWLLSFAFVQKSYSTQIPAVPGHDLSNVR